jgi:hypothetical protein
MREPRTKRQERVSGRANDASALGRIRERAALLAPGKAGVEQERPVAAALDIADQVAEESGRVQSILDRLGI